MSSALRAFRSSGIAPRSMYYCRRCVHEECASGPSKPKADITSMDLLEERIKKKALSREDHIGGQTLRWNYRSEIVQGMQLDRAHRNIWISFALIIAFGFTAFVKVKGDVIESRKAEMAERERIRKELNLTGERRKTVGIVPT